MNINFTGHKLEVTPAIRTFTTEKFDKLQRHFDNITSVNVTFDVEKLSQIAEAKIHVSGADIHARSESDDLYKAIDDLADKLDRQLLKHKEKIRNHRDKNGVK